jgi:hypothetical protein
MASPCLKATRTGLTPASDGELTTKDHLNTVTSSLLVARKIEANNHEVEKSNGPSPLLNSYETSLDSLLS